MRESLDSMPYQKNIQGLHPDEGEELHRRDRSRRKDSFQQDGDEKRRYRGDGRRSLFLQFRKGDHGIRQCKCRCPQSRKAP